MLFSLHNPCPLSRQQSLVTEYPWIFRGKKSTCNPQTTSTSNSEFTAAVHSLPPSISDRLQFSISAPPTPAYPVAKIILEAMIVWLASIFQFLMSGKTSNDCFLSTILITTSLSWQDSSSVDRRPTVHLLNYICGWLRGLPPPKWDKAADTTELSPGNWKGKENHRQG